MEWEALCPAHDDRKRSLSIREGDDGRALLKCHATCLTEDVVAALGLEMKHLFPAVGRWNGQRRTIAAVYPYVDEDGEALYRVVRTIPKGFRHETPDGKGDWRSGRDCMASVRRVLYRLPPVLIAARAGEPIFYVEGEADADLLVGLGHCATTVAGGASNWGSVPDAARVLSGASVTVIPDRDAPGWRYADQVTESLRAVGCRVVVRASAAGNDFGDHAAAGFGVDELVDVDPQAELEALAESSTTHSDTFAMLARSIIRQGDEYPYRLDDACVRLYAVIDEPPGRTISGRNHVAKVLGWAPPKVSEHADHLVDVGLIRVTKQPSGRGHKADTYSIVLNPAREGAVGSSHSTAPTPDGQKPKDSDDSSDAISTPVDSSPTTAPTPDEEPPVPVTASDDRARVDSSRSTSPGAVGKPQTTAILSTSAMSSSGLDEASAVNLVLRHFPGAKLVDSACA
jgi:hypothetical protein